MGQAKIKAARFCQWEGCGEDISHRVHNALYCPVHQKQVRRNYNNAFRREDYAQKREKVLEERRTYTMRQANCQGCGESFSVPYTKPAPALCSFCQTDEIVARAEKPHKESLGERVNCLIVEPKPCGEYYVDGRWLLARMVI